MPVYTPSVSVPAMPVYNVRDYGAVGNGTTDDAAAATAAVSAASTNGGGTVYFPKGTYRIGSAWTALASTYNIRVVGQAGGSAAGNPNTGSVLVCDAALGAGARAFSVDGANNLELRNLVFKTSAQTSTTAVCLYLGSASEVTIANCAFVNSGTARFGYGISMFSASRVTIDTCSFMSWLTSINGDPNSEHFTVRGTYHNSFTTGISVQGRQWIVSNNRTFDGTASNGLLLSGTVINAYIENNRFQNIASVANTVASVTGTVTGVTFIGNHFDNVGATSFAANRGLSIGAAVTGLNLIGNFFDTNGGTALDFGSGFAHTGIVAGNRYGTSATNRVANVPQSGALRFVESPEGTYNVRDFGAKGDGSNNDATAISAAVSAANANGGGTVYFPKGNYLFSTATTFSGLLGVKLVGQAGVSPGATPSVVFKYGAVSNTSPWLITGGSSGVEVRNIRFEINSQTLGTVNIVDFTNATDLTVANCTFTNTNATKAGGVYLGGVRRASFDHCHFMSTAYGLRGDSSTSNIAVRDCYFDTNTTAILAGGAANYTLVNCWFGNQVTNAIDATGGTALMTVQGCRFIAGSANTSIVGYFSTATITGNKFEPTSTGIPIQLNTSGSTNILVANNTFGQGTCGIDFGNFGHSGSVANNSFAMATRYLNYSSLTQTMSIVDDQTPLVIGTHPLFDTASARWYPLNPADPAALTTATFTNNESYAMPFFPGRRGSLVGIAINIASAATAGTVRAGMFSDAGGRPGTLLADFGTIAATTTAGAWTPSFAFLPQPMWLVLTPQGITGTFQISFSGARNPMVGHASITNFTAATGAYVTAAFTGAYGTVGSTTFGTPSGVDLAPQTLIKLQ